MSKCVHVRAIAQPICSTTIVFFLCKSMRNDQFQFACAVYRRRWSLGFKKKEEENPIVRHSSFKSSQRKSVILNEK